MPHYQVLGGGKARFRLGTLGTKWAVTVTAHDTIPRHRPAVLTTGAAFSLFVGASLPIST